MSPVEFEESSVIKVLGLRWCPSKDCFSYKVSLSQPTSCTKRRILSDASRVFDPLGFLAPVVVAIKIFFQDLWREKVGWDDDVPQELEKRWTTIRDELHLVESILIPRVMWSNRTNKELHAFCDASLDAYAAVVYCRSVDTNGNVTVSIVAAKSRVAPIKVLSLPKLELCGALLLTKLVDKIKTSLQEANIRVFAWTDSSIVLHWLSTAPKKWSVFVANRTSEIQSSIPFKSWNHVRSVHNPADVASRGIPPSLLSSTDIWWQGPCWLKKQPTEWPVSHYNVNDIPCDILEQRKSTKVQALMQGFWKRWHQEYLTSLQSRPKWQKAQRNLEVNDVVLLKEDNLPPSKWILGRVTEIHLGQDNKCRVATVKTINGSYVRPVVKLAPLPLTERPESSRGGQNVLN
ncbi:uncharacterized protein LOC129952483 [Eupeodes corollae]|uniref:uncharacterized protein LOC129952483 n=1 Tax=Eupeodes corollae TaxID=290404 RepID=UPI002493C34A|nr:uncharacterized protein LOC129952483 [Eupeodes corollae]